MYIVLEWVIWTGKSTQSKKLAEWFREQQPDAEVVEVREPGGSEIAEAIRVLVQGTEFDEQMSPLTDIYLYASARAQLLESVVRPALERWAIVISDRSFCSSLTIQWVAQGMWMDRVWEVNKEAVKETMPDMILFMDLDVDEWISRTFDGDGDKFEKRKAEFSHKIYEGCEMLFDFAPTKDLMRRVDASGSVEEVFERVVKLISEISKIGEVS